MDHEIKYPVHPVRFFLLNDLNDFLRGTTDEAGNHMRPQPGNSGAKIRENFTREERLQTMADFYRLFGDSYPDAARDFFNQHLS